MEPRSFAALNARTAAQDSRRVRAAMAAMNRGPVQPDVDQAFFKIVAQPELAQMPAVLFGGALLNDD